MRFLITGLICGWLITGLIFQHSLTEVRDELGKANASAKSANADADDLARQLDEADATHEHAATTATQAKAAAEKQADELNQLVVKQNADAVTAKATIEKQAARIVDAEKTAAAKAESLAEANKKNDELTKQVADQSAEYQRQGTKLKELFEKALATERVNEENKQQLAELEKRVTAEQVRAKEAAREYVKWSSGSLNAALAKGKQLNRITFVDLAPDWCMRCTRIKNTTLVDPKVVPVLHNEMVPAVIGKEFGDKTPILGMVNPPCCVLVTPDGKVSRPFEPEEDPAAFLKQLETEKAELVK